MKKRSLQVILTISMILIILAAVSASIKPNLDTYTTKDSIYVLSTVGSNDYLCRSQNPPQEVSLYIVEHKEKWNDQDSFEDIRNNPSKIPNSKISNTKIWENAPAGEYDLIVDCNEDKIYNEFSEPYSTGFKVIPKKGQGSMSKGKSTPTNFEWQYDPEELDLKKEILQLKLLAIDEDIELKNLTFEIDSPSEIVDIELYFDANSNGILDGSDNSIYKKENARKKEIANIDYKIIQDIETNFLFVLSNNENTLKGEYNLKIVSLTGEGVSSKDNIRFFGNPVISNKMKVVDPKSCLGEIEIDLSPNPAVLNQEVNVKISGLTGCDGSEVKIKANECHVATGDLTECTLESNECEITIEGVSGKYFACVDKDDNNNYNSFGESGFVNLNIFGEPIVNENEETINIGEEETSPEIENEITEESDSQITGNIISNLKDLGVSNRMVIILEITLLLILVFLILIFYRIIKPKKDKKDEGDSEEKKEQDKDNNEDNSDLFEEVEDKPKKEEKEKKDSKKKKEE